MTDEKTIEEPQHLEDIVSANFDALEAEAVEQEETEEEENTNEEVVAEATEEGVTEEEVQEETTETTDEIDAATDEEPEYDEAPPVKWNENMRNDYNKLPPEAKKLMMEGVYKPMERANTTKTMELAAQRRQVEPLFQAMQQHGELFAQSGANPQEVIQNQIGWAAHITRVGPEKGLADLKDSFGLSQQGQDQEEEYLTPFERETRDRQDRIEYVQSQQQQYAQQQEQRRRDDEHFNRKQGIKNSLQSFISEQKDGKLVHPHMNKVAPQIAGILKGGLVRRTDDTGRNVPFLNQVQQAYDIAVEMNPKLRNASNVDNGQMKRAKAAQDVSVVTTMPSGSPSDVPDRSLYDTINDTYDALKGRTG